MTVLVLYIRGVIQEYWDTDWENALSEARGITRRTWRINERKLAKR